MGRTGSSVNTMYRSVPPRPYSYTFSDILQTSLHPRTPGHQKSARTKTAPVSTYTPEEYAERFKSRPTTRPSVIDFNGVDVKMYSGSGGNRRFNIPGFPAVRTKNGPAVGKFRIPGSEHLPEQPPPDQWPSVTQSLHLAPLGRGGDPAPFALPPRSSPAPKTPELSRHHRLRSSASSILSRGRSSAASYTGRDTRGRSAASSQRAATAANSDSQWQELSNSKLSTLDAFTFTVTPQALGESQGYAEALARSQDYEDLTELPKPKKILPRRDLPWVFRYKVKKEMNALSKIMASRPLTDTPSTAAG